jgi:hypothetical protein
MSGKVNYNQEKQKMADLEARKTSGGYGDAPKWLTIKFGDTKFMVCPPKDENAPWYHEIAVHYGFQDSTGKNRAYLCSKIKHGKCPICDQAAKLAADGKLDKNNDITAVKGFLFNVLHVEDENGKNMNFELKILNAKASQKNEIVSEYTSYNQDEDVDAADLNNRRVFRGSRLKVDPWFTGRILSKQAELPDEVIKQRLANLNDLTKAYVDNAPEELQRLLNGEEINVKKSDGTIVKKEETVTETKVAAPTTAPVEHKAPVTPTPAAKQEVKTTAAVETKTPNRKLSTDELMAKLGE